MKEHINIFSKKSPVLIDKFIQELQTKLLDNFSWLDYAFGRSYTVEEDGARFPAAYNGNGEYISLLPNDNIGNFSWFDIYDPQDILAVVYGKPNVSFSGALTLWYNLKDINADADVLYAEEVKNEIASFLTRPGLMSFGHLKPLRIYERPESLYKQYISSIKNELVIYPYATIKIEFEFKTNTQC